MSCNWLSVHVAAWLVSMVACLFVSDDWVRQEKLLPLFLRANVSNVLRCGKLCERQSKCSAATYDTLEKSCYLHDVDTATVTTKAGPYLYSGSVGRRAKLDTERKCSDTQLYLPGLNGGGVCRDIQYADFVYLGCFQDNIDRDLLLKITMSGTNSKAVCVSACREKGYRFCGLQYGKECWCGNSYGKHGMVADDKCYMQCSGNAEEICGGYWTQNIYATGL